MIQSLFSSEHWTAPNVIVTALIAGAFALTPCGLFRVLPNVSYGDVLFVTAGLCTLPLLAQRPGMAKIPLTFLLAALVFCITGLLSYIENNVVLNLIFLSRFLIASILMPMLIAYALGFSDKAVTLAATAWVIGATFSASVALLNHQGYWLFGLLDERVYVTGRYSGLTSFPNILAVNCVFATVFLFYAIANPRMPQWVRVLALAATVVNLYAIHLTGSRTSIVALFAGLGFAVLTWPSGRTRLRLIAGMGVSAILIIGFLTTRDCAPTPPNFDCSNAWERLFGKSDVSSQESDAMRYLLTEDAYRRFWQSPLLGSGYEHIRIAHNIYLQVLVSGGIVGFAGFLLYLGWIGVLYLRLRLSYAKVGKSLWQVNALAACVVVWLVSGLAQPFTLERNCYVAVGLLLALYLHRNTLQTDTRAMPLPA